ncbi:MAG: hypothetical protein H0U23_05280 [Blastocatellia bacterium]|nr:hypothetical protein [Blastocatellia bacterium]
MLFISPKLKARAVPVAVCADDSDDGTLSVLIDGPDFVLVEPTTIGVGVTRGAGIEFGFNAGMEFVTTTFTGVGEGSTAD